MLLLLGCILFLDLARLADAEEGESAFLFYFICRLYVIKQLCCVKILSKKKNKKYRNLVVSPPAPKNDMSHVISRLRPSRPAEGDEERFVYLYF